MNKRELIEAVADKSGFTQREVRAVLEASLKVKRKALSNGEKISINGWGSYNAVERKARIGVDPRSRETIQVRARTVVKFRAAPMEENE